MTNTEKAAMELVNEVLSNPKLPTERIKLLSLKWIEVYDQYLPDLNIQYYEEREI